MRRRPSPALIVACVALVAAMSGAAVALPGKNSVKSNDIAKNAVKDKQIKKNAVRSSEIKNGKVKSADLKDESVNGKKVADGSLSATDLGDYAVLGDGTKVAATAGVDFDVARAAAPETPLYSTDTIEIYAKCLLNSTTTRVRGEIYVRTSADGAMMEGQDDLPGTGSGGTEFLTVATLEADRQLDVQNAGPNAASYDEAEGAITTAKGRSMQVLTAIGAKQGNPAGGNGPFGVGDVCLFGGSVHG
jgi:hypothetical protein